MSWWYDDGNIVKNVWRTDRKTARETDWTIHRADWSQLKTIWYLSMLFQALCSISYPLVNSNWSYSPETPNLGQIRRFLEPCDLEICRMTLKNYRASFLCYLKIWGMALKNNRAPVLSNIKLNVSFHQHMWIQTGVTVRKRPIWVKFEF